MWRSRHTRGHAWDTQDKDAGNDRMRGMRRRRCKDVISTYIDWGLECTEERQWAGMGRDKSKRVRIFAREDAHPVGVLALLVNSSCVNGYARSEERNEDEVLAPSVSESSRACVHDVGPREHVPTACRRAMGGLEHGLLAKC